MNAAWACWLRRGTNGHLGGVGILLGRLRTLQRSTLQGISFIGGVLCCQHCCCGCCCLCASLICSTAAAAPAAVHLLPQGRQGHPPAQADAAVGRLRRRNTESLLRCKSLTLVQMHAWAKWGKELRKQAPTAEGKGALCRCPLWVPFVEACAGLWLEVARAAACSNV